MPFEPHRLPKSASVYRGLGSKGWLDKNYDPWGVKFAAFLRKRKDDEGLSVFPEAYLCWKYIQVFQIARLEVGQIEEIGSRNSGEKLHVWQDDEEHAYIVGLPFHDDDEQRANDLATDLAAIAKTLTEREFEDSKWVGLHQASEGRQQG